MSRIFADDWRDCLREQYKYVVRQQDSRTEATLIAVLHEAGFSDDELAALHLEATLRADDMPEDYVPEEIQRAYSGVDVLPAEPVAMIDEDPLDEAELEPEAVIVDDLEAEAPEDSIDIAEDIDDEADAPQQMSLF